MFQSFILPFKKVVEKVKKTSKKPLGKAISGTFGVNVANSFLAYLKNLLLARFLGVEGFGTFNYVLAWVKLLQIPAGLGLEGIIIREGAIYHNQSQPNLFSGLIRLSNKAIITASLILGFLAFFLFWGFDFISQPEILWVFALGLISLPLRTLLTVQEAVLLSLKKIVVAQLPRQIIQPIILIVFAAGLYYLFQNNLTATWAMAIEIISIGAAFIFFAIFSYRSLDSNIQDATPQYRTRFWLTSAVPMLFISGVNIINTKTDLLMLGSMIDDKTAVGLYTVANQLTELVTFVLIAFNTALAPNFATLYSEGNREELQNLLTKSSRLILLASIPMALGLIFFGQWILLIFGSEFVAAQSALIILTLGKLTSSAAGSVRLLLNMSGHQRYTALGVGVSALCNIILNAWLIPKWGIEGAAIATATSTILWNIILAFFVYKEMRIIPTAIGKVG